MNTWLEKRIQNVAAAPELWQDPNFEAAGTLGRLALAHEAARMAMLGLMIERAAAMAKRDGARKVGASHVTYATPWKRLQATLAVSPTDHTSLEARTVRKDEITKRLCGVPVAQSLASVEIWARPKHSDDIPEDVSPLLRMTPNTEDAKPTIELFRDLPDEPTSQWVAVEPSTPEFFVASDLVHELGYKPPTAWQVGVACVRANLLPARHLPDQNQ